MEDLASFWSYPEIVEELQRKLLYATLELESLRMEAAEEIKKNKENVKNLLHLLHLVNRERDEARQDVQRLLDKLLHLPSSGSDLPTKAYSSATESKSFFESPSDSFFNGVSSPVFSNSSMADSSNLVGLVQTDPSSAVIDSFTKGKALPPKGKLLQAVTAAGPLLQTLLLAGPLPRWRIPPPSQLFTIPPVSLHLKPDSEPVNSSSPYLDISRGSSQMCSASILNFSNVSSSSSSSGSCFEKVNSQILSGKRQRFH